MQRTYFKVRSHKDEDEDDDRRWLKDVEGGPSNIDDDERESERDDLVTVGKELRSSFRRRLREALSVVFEYIPLGKVVLRGIHSIVVRDIYWTGRVG
ncbi:hypothetical protein PIB30_006594 [Stylosanthes scabra]|uniref:Uncharacterized protein n=1 Tax=Stylosanthes scabra TaxID=79078 RepID=A0ABU6Y4P6_9FABA|nr:hypothetical protein [Stylosanthes scabra]